MTRTVVIDKAAPTRTVKYGSMSRDRTWALRWSYFFLTLFAMFSLIVTFANFDIVRILTYGGPLDHTHIFATWAFRIGIEGSDIPLGASASLFMLPILAIAAVFILRDINKRGNEA